MQEINIEGLIHDREMTQSDEDLILVLAESNEHNLIKLSLGLNATYWRQPSTKRHFMEFIQKQNSLEVLQLHTNFFSSEQTEEVFSFLCSCTKLLQTITGLNMFCAANFDTDRACELLAQFIDAATRLKFFDI